MKKFIVFVILLITFFTIGCQNKDPHELKGTLILEEGKRYRLDDCIENGEADGFLGLIVNSFDGIADSWDINHPDIIDFDGEFITALSQGEAVLKMMDEKIGVGPCNKDTCENLYETQYTYVIEVKVKAAKQLEIPKLNNSVNSIRFEELEHQNNGIYWFEITAEETAVYRIGIYDRDKKYCLNISWELYTNPDNQDPDNSLVSFGMNSLFFYLKEGETVYVKANAKDYGKVGLYRCEVTLECE